MAFMDTDPLEEEMRVRCEDMTPDQLVVYLKDWQEAVNDITLGLDGKEIYSMRWLQKVYGPDAGLIVKWVCYKHRGKDDRGQYIVHRMFCTKMKWWIDKLYAEMQVHRRREERRKSPREAAAISGWATSL
ncbi:hypothetical protein SEA_SCOOBYDOOBYDOO_181 [Mycobacterium phage ScoobyDoobyDoo]|nr:hypothetical protein SEA_SCOOBYDOOBYDOO_181 [Mycobacterium phage ScoobyDoobyDoo]